MSVLGHNDTALIEHVPECFWLRANPSVDGDEGACCNCGAYEENMLVARVAAERDTARGALHDIYQELTHGRTANWDYIDKRYEEGMGGA